jgi:DnaJ-class molecular chaperone
MPKRKVLSKIEEEVFDAEEKKVLRAVKAKRPSKKHKKCSKCRGTGTAVYTGPEGSSFTEICDNCEGTGYEGGLEAFNRAIDEASMEETTCG